MEFIFACTPYQSPALQGQLHRVLEKRTELVSREKHPEMWKKTDALNREKVSEMLLAKRRARYKLCGAVLAISGALMVIMGVMEPMNLSLLITGAASLALGIAAFGLRRTSPFERGAKQILEGLQTVSPFQVHFDEQGMTIGGSQVVPYEQMQWVFTTADLLVLIWEERITVLQNKDLQGESPQTLERFLMRKMGGAQRVVAVGESF